MNVLCAMSLIQVKRVELGESAFSRFVLKIIEILLEENHFVRVE